MADEVGEKEQPYAVIDLFPLPMKKLGALKKPMDGYVCQCTTSPFATAHRGHFLAKYDTILLD